ncbi:MAG: hypothetical protein LBK44_03295 [Spirochaetales bacterium]|nr:hypothetical protein [Spirochaetales bacterium]
MKRSGRHVFITNRLSHDSSEPAPGIAEGNSGTYNLGGAILPSAKSRYK